MLCLGGSKKPLGREGEAAGKSDVPRSQRGAHEMGENQKKKTPFFYWVFLWEVLTLTFEKNTVDGFQKS